MLFSSAPSLPSYLPSRGVGVSLLPCPVIRQAGRLVWIAAPLHVWVRVKCHNPALQGGLTTQFMGVWGQRLRLPCRTHHHYHPCTTPLTTSRPVAFSSSHRSIPPIPLPDLAAHPLHQPLGLCTTPGGVVDPLIYRMQSSTTTHSVVHCIALPIQTPLSQPLTET